MDGLIKGWRRMQLLYDDTEMRRGVDQKSLAEITRGRSGSRRQEAKKEATDCISETKGRGKKKRNSQNVMLGSTRGVTD